MAKVRDKIASIAFGDIVGRGLGFFTSVYLARILGADSYGLIIVALSWLGYFVWVSELGLMNIGTREIAKEPVKRIFRAKEIFTVKVILGLTVFVLCYLIIPTLNLPDLQKKLILGFSFSLIPYSLFMEWYYNGSQHFGKVAFARIVNGAVYFGLVLFFIQSSSDIEKVPNLYTTGIISSTLTLGVFAFFNKPFVLPSRGWAVFKDLFRSAATIGFGTFFGQLMILYPPIAIGLFQSNIHAGWYGASIRIIIIILLVDKIFYRLYLPNISSLWTSNKDLAKQNLDYLIRIMLVIGTALSLFVSISSTEILTIVFGKEYAPAGPILSALSLYIVLTFLNSIFSFGLVAINKDKEFFHSKLAGGIIAAIIITLSAYFGDATFAAAGVTFSELIIMLFAFSWFSRFIKLKVAFPFIVSIILASLIYLGSSLINMNPFIEAIISVIILVPMLFAVGVVNSDQIKWMKDRVV